MCASKRALFQNEKLYTQFAGLVSLSSTRNEDKLHLDVAAAALYFAPFISAARVCILNVVIRIVFELVHSICTRVAHTHTR